MLFKKVNTKGESLIETLIALSLITFAIFGATTLIVSSIQVSNSSQKRIIATNLARECVEGMRAIRDTNWLLYGNSKRLCWNHNFNENPTCDGTEPIASASYRMDMLSLAVPAISDLHWKLDPEINDTDWENFRLYLEEIPDLGVTLYTHRENDASGNKNERTEYQRRLQIKYLDNDLGNQVEEPNPAISNRMFVECQVRYKDSRGYQNISLATHLTDYFERTYDDN